MSGELPPLYAASTDDYGAYCIIFTVTWACITGLIMAIRVVLVLHRRTKIGSDDISFAVASVLAIVSTALYSTAVTSGLGQHINDVDARDVSRFFKINYAAQVIGIAGIGCSKPSAALLTQRVILLAHRCFYTLIIGIAAWTVFSLCATAFQCQTPINMLTDLALAGWVVMPVWRVNMPKHDRIIVISLFEYLVWLSASLRDNLIFPRIFDFELRKYEQPLSSQVGRIYTNSPPASVVPKERDDITFSMMKLQCRTTAEEARENHDASVFSRKDPEAKRSGCETSLETDDWVQTDRA